MAMRPNHSVLTIVAAAIRGTRIRFPRPWRTDQFGMSLSEVLLEHSKGLRGRVSGSFHCLCSARSDGKVRENQATANLCVAGFSSDEE
jgi:hypothetical protein